MMCNAPKKPQIGYSKYQTTFEGHKDRKGNLIPVILHCFYPDGQWDEDKLTKAEAEARYPRSKYVWKLLKD